MWPLITALWPLIVPILLGVVVSVLSDEAKMGIKAGIQAMFRRLSPGWRARRERQQQADFQRRMGAAGAITPLSSAPFYQSLTQRRFAQAAAVRSGRVQLPPDASDAPRGR